MSTKATTAELQAAQDAIADEVAACIRRKRRVSGMQDGDIARAMGVSQTWLSRRVNGHTPWSAAELQLLCNIIDEDITRVFAAGALALEKAQHTTNLNLSQSVSIDAERHWARRGYELALTIFSPRMQDLDSPVCAA